MIAYFGTGLLGSGFVRNMLERGETVHVWNRSPEKARALEADGAKAFADPRDAVRGASQIHLTLSDDAATRPARETPAERHSDVSFAMPRLLNRNSDTLCFTDGSHTRCTRASSLRSGPPHA